MGMAEKRLIDANAVIAKYRQVVFAGQTYTLEDLRYAVEYAPTVDAVEVVRCKDCKRWEYDAKRMAGLCKRHINYTAQYDFCSYGERREDNVR